MHDSSSTQSLIEDFEKAEQGQVFRFLDALTPSEEAELLKQVGSIDLSEVANLVEAHVKKADHGSLNLEGLEPAPYFALPENGGSETAWENALLEGAKAIGAGRVAAFCVAGGQGTRLGYDGPKGTYPVTPISKKNIISGFCRKDCSFK